MSFPDMDVSVTMTGEEWVVLLCRIVGQPLSEKGGEIYCNAADKLQKQLTAASNANPSFDKKLANFLDGPFKGGR